MLDIALILDPITHQPDIALAAGDLVTDNSLYTAVLLSLGCDARAEAGDVLPVSSTDPRGWWADRVTPTMRPAVPAHRTGSKLWLEARSKQIPETLRRIEDRLKAALSWIVQDNYATSLTVQAEWIGLGQLGYLIVIDARKISLRGAL